MKFNLHTYLTALVLSLLTLTGCSSDDAMQDLGGGDAREGNIMTLRLALAAPANASSVTGNPTGGEYGDGLRVGRYNENSIYDVYLYKYSAADGINAADNTPVTLLAYEKDINFTPGSQDADANGVIVKELEMNVGAYRYEAGNNDHFIVAVNTEMFGTSTTLGELRNELVNYTCQQTGSQMKDYDRFAMSNAEDSRYEGGNGSKENPYVVSVNVERITARIDFAWSSAARTAGTFRIQNGKYIYKALGTEGDEVQLTHVRVTNNMRYAPYLIKRLAASADEKPTYLLEETNPATKYVVEPTTWSKTVQAVEDKALNLNFWFRESQYETAMQNYQSATAPWFRTEDKVHIGSGDAFTDGTSLDEEDNDWHYYILEYANENTMVAAQTLHHYTTGLILKATYAPQDVFKGIDEETHGLIRDEEYTTGTTFWRWHDVDTNKDLFFSNEKAATDYQALFPHSVVFPYNDGQCYYSVWLRHENIIDDPTTTMMEFGIVRNNIYRVCVEFTGIGMPDIPDDMTTPETIRMFIFVRKWNLITHPTIEI